MHKLFTYERVARLSFPYPSSRLITPHTPTPAPIAVTTVFKPVTAVVKNAILNSEPEILLLLKLSYFRKEESRSPPDAACPGSFSGSASFLVFYVYAFFTFHPEINSFGRSFSCSQHCPVIELGLGQFLFVGTPAASGTFSLAVVCAGCCNSLTAVIPRKHKKLRLKLLDILSKSSCR